MMPYKLRWLWMGIIFVAIMYFAYLYDVHDLSQQYLALSIGVKETQQNIENLRTPEIKNISDDAQEQRQEVLLSEVVLMLHAQGLQLLSVNFPQEHVLRLLMQGNYQQFATFVVGLNRNATTLLLTDFSLKMLTRHQLLISIDLLQLKYELPAASDSYLINADPFCELSAPAKINPDVSFEQMQMIGVMQQAGSMRAFIALPTKRVIAVQVGTVFGKEHGRVSAIKRDRVLVEVQGRRIEIRR